MNENSSYSRRRYSSAVEAVVDASRVLEDLYGPTNRGALLATSEVEICTRRARTLLGAAAAHLPERHQDAVDRAMWLLEQIDAHVADVLVTGADIGLLVGRATAALAEVTAT